MMIIVYLAGLPLGCLIGLLYGRFLHHRFLARGFRIMAAATRRDGVHEMSIYDLASRPVDVSNAFGKQEDIDFRVLGIAAANRALRGERDANVECCSSCGGATDSPPCQRDPVSGRGGHIVSGGSAKGAGS